MKAHRLATFALALAATTALPAQTIDLLTSNGGFTAQSLTGGNAWSWTAGTGWAVNSTGQVARQRLLSPVLTATGGAYSISATHRYNFEGSMNSTTCWDGGVVLASINGGAFAALMPPSGKSYDGVISSGFSNPLGGSQAFCRAQTSNVISTWTGTLAAGTTIQLALDGAWDSSNTTSNPNWNLRALQLSGLGTNVVPEPSTYALMATGLAGLAALRRRRAARNA